MTSSSAAPPAQQLVDIGLGFIYSAALSVAAELGVADLLVQGPRSAASLSEELRVDGPSLYRTLRLLASAGVFAEDAERRFALTPSAEFLRSDVPGSLRAGMLMITQNLFWGPAGQLSETVRTGRTVFDRLFGAPFFDHLIQDPVAGARFHRGMSSLSDMENGAIAGSYDFRSFRRLVDVGGGQGGFLFEVLQRAPHTRGVLFDHAHVLAEARVPEAGIVERHERVAGDFFQSVPAGADAYVLKRILHDWSDEVCVELLRRCREAMAEGGRVLVVDTVIPPGNAPHGGKVLDVMMMASLPGRERTEAEFRELFARAGLRLTRVVPTPTALSITEGEAAR
ncbi:MAG: methyltransferase [Cystobacter sp.]